MLDIKKILSRKSFARQYKGTFGVSKAQFDLLLVPFSERMATIDAQQLADRMNSHHRKNATGGGAKTAFADHALRLSFVLYYLKAYPTFDVLGSVYGITGSYANRLFHQWYPVLYAALDDLGLIPQSQFTSAEDFQAFLKEKGVQTILIDVTERLIEHPKYNQQDFYSGKKKGTL